MNIPKACPFCGVHLTPNNNPNDLWVRRYGTHYEHPTGGCYLSGDEVSPGRLDEWNRRAVEASDGRACTCHPDDNPPKPCPRKFALSECETAATQPEYPWGNRRTGLREWLFGPRKPKPTPPICADTGTPKDPYLRWNVRCQLGRTCCRSPRESS